RSREQAIGPRLCLPTVDELCQPDQRSALTPFHDRRGSWLAILPALKIRYWPTPPPMAATISDPHAAAISHFVGNPAPVGPTILSEKATENTSTPEMSVRKFLQRSFVSA